MFWKKKQKQEMEPQGTIAISEIGEKLYEVTVNGTVGREEWSRLQLTGGMELDRVGGPIRVLMDLRELERWRGTPGDGDIEFLLKYDSLISKIAVVGDPAKKAEAMLFLGAGYRQAQVEFFATDDFDEAQPWLVS